MGCVSQGVSQSRWSKESCEEKVMAPWNHPRLPELCEGNRLAPGGQLGLPTCLSPPPVLSLAPFHPWLQAQVPIYPVAIISARFGEGAERTLCFGSSVLNLGGVSCIGNPGVTKSFAVCLASEDSVAIRGSCVGL